MKIGLVSSGQWEEACDACGVAHVALPSPTPSKPDPHAADLATRICAGEKTFELLRRKPVSFILDDGGTGLTFIKGGAGPGDLKLTHEALNVPLVSCFADPVTTVLKGLPWNVVWQVLAGRTWIKALCDGNHAEELTRFGVPGCLHLPAAAPDREYETSPADALKPAIDVAFVGDASPCNNMRLALNMDGAKWIDRVAAAAHARNPTRRFFDLYHSVYRCAERPTSSDPFAHRVRSAGNYFAARLAYIANLTFQHRDRFVIFLKRIMGERFVIMGQDWDSAYGLPCVTPAMTPESWLRHVREAAVNIALIDPRSESALSQSHFEITAVGGFLLCYDHPEVASCFDIGKECDTFSDEESLREKVHYYLAHPQHRAEMALAGQRRTLREHLYRHRLETIMRAAVSPQHQGAPRICADAMTTPMERGDGSEVSPGNIADDELNTVRARVTEGAGRLLVLLNPGRVTRHCVVDMVAAASRLGIEPVVYELGEVWQALQCGQRPDVDAFASMLRERRVRAVIAYTLNGVTEWATPSPTGRMQSVFERLSIPHLLWWTDHPQWANNKDALRPEVLPLLSSSNNHHFVKSELAAREIEEILGWPNCHGLPVAENPEHLKPAVGVRPDFDVVTVLGSPPKPDSEIDRFLNEEAPDVDAINDVVARRVGSRLSSLWQERAPESLRSSLEAFSREWVEARRREPLTGSFWIFKRLEHEHPDATQWLRLNHCTYFDAIGELWEFGRWQRTFVLRYLARYFHVGILGYDWSSVGLGGGRWVEYDEQPEAYARGRIAINLSQAGDEEGVSHKPFQIAASGVPMLHINRRGLSDCFTPGVEVEVFDTSQEAREKVAALLADPAGRQRMADAALERLCREHTWEHRLSQMLTHAGVRFPGVLKNRTEALAHHPSCPSNGRTERCCNR